MNKRKPYDSILFRDGVSNKQREATVLLKKNYILPDEHSLEDIFNFAKAFAKKINFYAFEKINPANLSGSEDSKNYKNKDWEDFFKKVSNNDLASINQKSDFDPYLALFFSFIKLFGHAQNHLNEFIQRHLDFYYANFLNITLKPGVADNVYVIFELAKNAIDILCGKDTLLDAGKVNGSSLQYSITEDVALNRATVDALHTVTLEGENKDVVCFATKPDTQDGVSKELRPENSFWDAFGLKHINGDKPKKSIGFAIASPVLLLKGGTRNITVKLQLSGVTANLKSFGNLQTLQLFLSGEKSWLGPFAATVSFGSLNTRTGRQTMLIEYTLSDADPSVVPVNTAIHGNYTTPSPLMQILIDTQSGGNLYSQLKGAILQTAAIDVVVSGVRDFKAENDLGVVNPHKPFQPFGPVPKKGAAFTVYYDELMQKDVTDFNFDVTWLDAPEKFSDHYANYGVTVSNNSFQAKYRVKDNSSQFSTLLFNSADASRQVQLPAQPPVFRWTNIGIVPNLISYPSFYSLYSNPNYAKSVMQTLNFINVSNVATKIALPASSKDFIRFELANSFFHEKYMRVFTAKVMAGDKENLPNEPYTPVISSIALNYKASVKEVTIADSSFENFNQKQIQLFHLGVFGHSEQHGYLKALSAQELSDSGFTFDSNTYLVPNIQAGEFYIGLKEALPGQSVSLLFQLAEGSSNPDKDPQPVEWSVLCNNEWRRVGGKNILRDETSHLSQTGIIRMVLPDCTTAENTIMESGLTWIKASVPNNLDAICLFNKVLAQAARASRIIQRDVINESTLPSGSITKMASKPLGVKSLSQPFASFGGLGIESNHQYRVRVSERLRHKGRGVMNWDYEHMVLQQFPELFKVKCLNHFNDEGSCCKDDQPGNITLIVVPQVKNNNAYNPLEPKVAGALRDKVRNYVKSHVSFFTNVFVSNPDYEMVQFDFKVSFNAAGDFGLYKELLNDALKRYLTPWAFANNTELTFGGAIKKSIVLNFIEELAYVDFVTNLAMYHVDENGNRSADLDEITVSNPKAILITHSQHIINPFTSNDIC